MSSYTLYWCPGTCARVPFVALEEIGDPFKVIVVNRYGGTEEGYLGINPKGKVPALVIGSGKEHRAITENPAILTLLAQRHPAARLLPAGVRDDELEALEMMSWFAAGVHRFISPYRFPQLFCDRQEAYESIRLLARRQLEDAFALLEARLHGREWLFDEWSVLDVYMLWLWFRATGSGMDGMEFPRCADHAARCEARPSVERVLNREEEEYLRLAASGAILDTFSHVDFQVGRSPSSRPEA